MQTVNTEMMKKTVTGAEALILSLLEEGTDTLFGYIGGAIMPVYDALYGYSQQLNHIMTRHEQGAVHAAQAYARLKRKPGVCFTTSGPGATNLVTGIADAMIDSTPLVCITGQVTSSLLGMDAFQETDVVGITMPVTKWNFQISSPDEIPWAVAKAFYIANSGRPGPVVLDITKDAQLGTLEFAYQKCTRLSSYFPFPKPNAALIEKAARLINEAKRPLILAGQGVSISRAQDELLELAEKTGIPVACTLLGLSVFPSAHPLYAGMLGMHGNYAPNMLTNECDVLLAVGMRFDDRVTGDTSRYAKQAKIIHIEIDAAEIGKIVTPDTSILADAKEALAALLPLVEHNEHTEWMKRLAKYHDTERISVIDPQTKPANGPIKMAEVIRMVAEKTGGDTIVVTDVGQQQMNTARYFRFTRPNSFISSGGLGTMGFGLPAAIGAKVANPYSSVVAFIGDGGFQMTLQELQTLNDLQLPVKIVLLNNNYLGMVRQWQELFFESRYSFTEMPTPDFITIAKGFHLAGQSISERHELEEAVNTLLSFPGSFLLEVKVEREDNVFPMMAPGASVSEMKLK